MTRLLRWSGALVGGLVLLGAGALWQGGAQWRRETARAAGELRRPLRALPEAESPATPPGPAERLPDPVLRYFAFALGGDSRPIRGARVRWEGEMRLRPGAEWVPFSAEQHFSAAPPGFVWDAAVRMLPLVPMRVRDRYWQSQGSMLGRVGGLLPVVDQGGSPEIAQSALARWLGEAVWLPTALLPGAGVEWTAVDDRTARATVRDGGVTAAADFHFAPSGAITRMTAMRYRDVDGTPVLTPFEGRYGSYRWLGGVRVPRHAEVAWLLPEGRYAYWRGRPTGIEYQRAAAP